jgi:2-polyprenyl-3-methyl-5-hydroxy-6-metoxy-1,4-benzoquinol methylase
MSLYSTRYPQAAGRPTDRVEFGPNLPASLDRRLVGDLDGKRVLELGCGMGHASVSMAIRGAKVIGVDPDPNQLEHARQLCELSETKVELHHTEIADLAFLRADSFDLIVAIYSLASVADLDRVFRQAHRILRPEAAIVISLPHPSLAVLADPTRGFFDRTPSVEDPTTHNHLITDVFGGLQRANFRCDVLLEPETSAGKPGTLILRGRKQGI